MSELETILEDYARQMCGSLHADELYRTLLAAAFDGTEAYRTIDLALRGLDNESAVVKIKHALAQYKDTIPVRAAIEIMMTLLEKGGVVMTGGREPLSGGAHGRFGGDLSVSLLGSDRHIEVQCRGKGFHELYRWLDSAGLRARRSARSADHRSIPPRDGDR
jgi:hypothetical protein